MKFVPVCLTLFGVFAMSPATAADQGWYTPAQADRGHQLYNNYCAECHRPDLSGAMGPALIGKAFLDKWGGQPLGDLYGYEHKTMPAVNPGSLPAGELWTITAYILQKNGFEAGTAELTTTTGAQRVLTAK
jgi:mono/diheme cytochrome c family protein